MSLSDIMYCKVARAMGHLQSSHRLWAILYLLVSTVPTCDADGHLDPLESSVPPGYNCIRPQFT